MGMVDGEGGENEVDDDEEGEDSDDVIENYENYQNQELEDFPSDADIVSIQHTPKRMTDTPFSNQSGSHNHHFQAGYHPHASHF